MASGPSPIAERLVGILIPPACREEVLGDLHERYRSPLQYLVEAVVTVPMVVTSRVRRVVDPQILMMQTLALYTSFLGAAWLMDRALLNDRWGLVRLTIPVAMMILGLLLDDTYSRPRRRPALVLARGPLLGLFLAFFSQETLWRGFAELALPRGIMFAACGMSLLLTSGIRLLFPPVIDQMQSANVPALLLKREGGSLEIPGVVLSALKWIAIAVVLATAAVWLGDRPVPRNAGVGIVLALGLIAYRLTRRA